MACEAMGALASCSSARRMMPHTSNLTETSTSPRGATSIVLDTGGRMRNASKRHFRSNSSFSSTSSSSSSSSSTAFYDVVSGGPERRGLSLIRAGCRTMCGRGGECRASWRAVGGERSLNGVEHACRPGRHAVGIATWHGLCCPSRHRLPHQNPQSGGMRRRPRSRRSSLPLPPPAGSRGNDARRTTSAADPLPPLPLARPLLANARRRKPAGFRRPVVVVCDHRAGGSSAGTATSAIADRAEQVAMFADEEDYVKAGGADLKFVKMQAGKSLDQPKIASKLQSLVEPSLKLLDLVVVGCGPAGLALAAEAGKEGLSVGLIGPDVPFINNYGVWHDEFQSLGLEHCIEQVYENTVIYLEDDKRVLLDRKYGRVGRSLLREELLRRCAENGVMYVDSEVDYVQDMQDGGSTLVCKNGLNVQCRLSVIAAGAAAGKFLTYEAGVPAVCVQTAYGMEVEVEASSFDPTLMHFMDYRDFKGREEAKSAGRKNARSPFGSGGAGRGGGGGEGGVESEIPTFLYVMPTTKTRLFLEETCLAARPGLTFQELKERLDARIKTLGLKVLKVHEEEWSYIPVGGALPIGTQPQLAFGAAASMIHPATGYSIVRSLSEAPRFAKEIASSLRLIAPSKSPRNAAFSAWGELWSRERRRQRAFFLFGLELLIKMDLFTIRDFFDTFFRLPEWLWRGFLSSSLSSFDLVMFAFGMFVYGSNSMRSRLVRHLLTDPSGAYVFRVYMGLDGVSQPSAPSARGLAALAILLTSGASSTAKGLLPLP